MRMEVKMTKVLKRITAAAMALIMMMTAVGCSGDKSWAAEKDKVKVPVGVYIFYLYSAYNQASSKVTDTTKPILSQKIENKDASTWIRDTAMTSLKSYLVIDAKMKELNLTLTDAEKKSASDNTTQAWGTDGTTLQGYGISQSSFDLAYSQYSAKCDKVFLAMYGKNGKSAVSDADLKTYFEKTFTDFNYFSAPLYTTDAKTGASAALTDTQKAALKKEFDNYATQINSGKMTVTQAAAAFKTSSKATTDPLQSYTTVISSTDTSDFAKAITAAKVGVAQSTEISNNYVLLLKNDITKKTDSQLGNDTGRNNVLYQMKGTDFDTYLKSEAGKLTGVTFNDAAINDQKIDKFASAPSSVAPTTSAKAGTTAPATTASK